MYRLLFALILSHLDPERAHRAAFAAIRTLPALGLRRILLRITLPRTDQSVTTLGQRFPTPFGLAAGFDKNAVGVLGLGALGFGHVEIGTVTAVPQAGNARPRLFRLISDRALINRMGFNNDGAERVAQRLKRLRGSPRCPVIGVNIGKSRNVPVDDAVADYVTSATLLAPEADYVVVNVSSPNTPGLRGLQDTDRLVPLLEAVKRACGPTPLLVKIAPDLTDGEVEQIGQLVERVGLDGIVATNTTTAREGLLAEPAVVAAAGAGGLSGAPLAARSLEVLTLLRQTVSRDTCIISLGGVETGSDVSERLAAGATLVQGYTAFVYRGPLWVRSINRVLDLTTAA
jgi:dihydroorotate dehydrogenase